MLDYVALEMRMAELMAQQEASGFRFDMDAAERVRKELSRNFASRVGSAAQLPLADDAVFLLHAVCCCRLQ